MEPRIFRYDPKVYSAHGGREDMSHCRRWLVGNLILLAGMLIIAFSPIRGPLLRFYIAMVAILLLPTIVYAVRCVINIRKAAKIRFEFQPDAVTVFCDPVRAKGHLKFVANRRSFAQIHKVTVSDDQLTITGRPRDGTAAEMTVRVPRACGPEDELYQALTGRPAFTGDRDGT